MADIEGKKLTELRVIDLKTELERRGLDKTGNKAALLERLSKAISDDGENPEEYLIVPCGGVCKTSPRKNSVTGVPNQDDTLESSENQKEENVEQIKKENTDVQDNNDLKTKLKPKSSPEESPVTVKKEDISNDTTDNLPKEEVKQEIKTPLNRTSTENIQSCEKKNEIEKIPPSNQSSTTGAAVEANGMDNEDSINLTIGEDEENLLAEETESHDRHKDGGEKKKMEENKKGDSKGSGRAEAGASNKEGTTSGANVGMKNKQEGGDGSKRLVSHS